MALRNLGAWQLWGPLLGFAAFAGGCKQEDAERMARVGRKLTARIEAVNADQAGGLNKGWQTVCNGWQETTLAGRVTARLRWDKKLVDAQIQASTTGNLVELKGTVRDLEQRRRAVDLAESTTGVDKVTEALEVAPP
jgi:osmotically-inducible protein OsmY